MSRYVADFVMSFFHVDYDRAVKMVAEWRKAGRFQEDKYRSPRTRKERSRVRSKNAGNDSQQTASQQQTNLF
jgi:hypothetical protein